MEEEAGRVMRSTRRNSQHSDSETRTRRTRQKKDSSNSIEEESPAIEEKVSSNLIEEMLKEAAKGVIMETIPTETETTPMEEHENDFVLEPDTEYVKSTSSSPAIAESLLNNNNEGEANDSEDTIVDADAEMVSEDELPMPVKPKINDAEEVSDEELPGPRRAELPADAEVVSEDELPTPKRAEIPADADSVSEDELPKTQDEKKDGAADNEKMESEDVEKKSPRKRKVNEEVDESNSKEEDQAEKKAKLESSANESPNSKKKKKLPDLDKYWKTVHDDTSDFTGWTYLLQYVDQESDVEAAREAYDAFLSHYPYCYGYWRKYADYEKRKGDKSKAEEVCQRGLMSIPLSVDLWIYYLSFVKSTYSDNEEHVRAEFEKAIDQCGLEFRSDKLWDAYIKWETDGKRYNKVLGIYDRLVAVPTQGYSTHFNNFQDLINNHSPSSTVTAEEFKSIRQEIRENAAKSAARKKEREREKERDRRDKDKEKRKDDKEDKDRKKDKSDNEEKSDDEKPKEEEVELIPEETEPEDDFHVKNEDELAQIKEKIISIRRKVHKQTVTAVTARWTFEEAIKRPYFHVKPLEKCQINNWKEYLDYEIEKGDIKRILILFERCLIACALYDDFWLKMIRFLESQNENDKFLEEIRYAYERACTIHHTDKPNLHLLWSAFEEQYGNIDKAAEILESIDKVCPNLLQVAYRRVNVERRRGNLEKCKDLYENYIKNAKDKKIAGCLAIKYSRFLHKIFKNFDAAHKVMKDVLAGDQSNTRVALHLIDMSLQRDDVDEEEIVGIIDSFMGRENIELDQKILFAQRKVEFLEDFGKTSKGLQDAQKALQVLLKKAKEQQKKLESEKKSKEATTTQSSTATATTTAAAYTAANNYNYSSYYTAAQQQHYQQSYDSYGYNHWQYGTSGATPGYGSTSYGQWNGSYGSYY